MRTCLPEHSPTSVPSTRPPRPAVPSSVSPRPTGLVLSPFRALRYAVPPTSPRSPPRPTTSSTPTAWPRSRPASDPTSCGSSSHVRSPAPAGPLRARRDARCERLARERGARAGPGARAVRLRAGRPAAGTRQRGLLGALALTPPEDGIVLPHENTMAGPGRATGSRSTPRSTPTSSRSSWSTTAAAPPAASSRDGRPRGAARRRGAGRRAAPPAVGGDRPARARARSRPTSPRAWR